MKWSSQKMVLFLSFTVQDSCWIGIVISCLKEYSPSSTNAYLMNASDGGRSALWEGKPLASMSAHQGKFFVYDGRGPATMTFLNTKFEGKVCLEKTSIHWSQPSCLSQMNVLCSVEVHIAMFRNGQYLVHPCSTNALSVIATLCSHRVAAKLLVLHFCIHGLLRWSDKCAMSTFDRLI